MPALNNPRHEAFAFALFVGLAGKTRQARSQQQAYLTAYPNSSTEAAKTSASRLLTRANHIIERVLELQAEQTKRTQKKIDVSRERVARDLDEAIQIAKDERNPQGITSAAMGIAKVFGLEQSSEKTTQSFKDAQNMEEIGKRLLISVGLKQPSDGAIQLAIEANDAFVARLEEIREEHEQADS